MTMLAAIQAQKAGLQQSALTGYELSAILRKTIASPVKDRRGIDPKLQKDTLSVAEPLKALSIGGIDLERSRFIQTSQLLSFHVTYQETSFRQLSLQGYYDFNSQSITADLSFISALAIKDSETGEERQELFRFNFHLEAQHSIYRSGSTNIQKEDILQFARKLVSKIAKLHLEGKEIDGLALDSEDLKELGAVDDGRLLKSIVAFVQILRNINFLQKREGEHVLVDLDRQKALITTENKQEQETLSFSLTVERVVHESNTEPMPIDTVQSP
jgi:hypothetical protein